MIGLFRDYIKAHILNYMRSEYSEFDCKNTSKSMQFSKKLENGITVYILFRFFSDKDYVIPNFLWTKKKKIPTEDCIDLARYAQFEEDWGILDGDDEAFLSATEFGYFSNAFDLDEKHAPLERLQELFSSEDASTVKDFYQIDDWRREPIYHSWDMVDELFPGSINNEDLEAATKKLLENIMNLLVGEYRKYLLHLESVNSN